MNRVIIRLNSQQVTPEGELVSEHTSSAVGHWQKKANSIIVRYHENEDSGLGDTVTVLKWTGDRLVVVRSGDVESRQEFAVGLHKTGMYRTPHGNIELDYETLQLSSEQHPGQLNLSVIYGQSVGNVPRNITSLWIEIEEDTTWTSRVN